MIGDHVRNDTMKKLGVGLIASLSLLVAARGQTDIYVFAGQSNMAGPGPMTPGAPALVNPGRVLMWNTVDTFWQPAKDPTSGNPAGGVSPVLYAGDGLASDFPGRTIGVVNIANGGTNLGQWAPDFSIESNYGIMMQNAFASAKACGGTIRGFFWYQGESDTGSVEQVHEYGPAMYQLLTQVHQTLGCPIVFVQLGPVSGLPGEAYWGDIQLVQQWIADGAPSWLSMVTAKDLSNKGSNSPHHLNSASRVILGGRMAAAMYQLLCSGQ
jgi:hypothetical protein